MKVEMDFDQKKFFIIIILTCILFFILVMNALDSAETQKIQALNDVNKKEEVVKSEKVQTTNQEEVLEEEKKDLNTKKTLVKNEKVVLLNDETGELDVIESPKSDKNINDLEIIEENEQKVLRKTPEVLLEDARTLIKDKQYVKAIDILVTIPNKTNDTNIIASSYEEIALVYAIAKKYGTALSFAQKAFNMAPTNSREILLARLYYKTGDRDKATNRMYNVLQRDFVSNSTK